jgi:hypothetical protein
MSRDQAEREPMRYRVNAPQVIAETVAGETMIVNLGTGHYFNLQGAGVDIWECVEQGLTEPTIVAILEARYSAEEGEIDGSVRGFVGELEREDLIVQAEGQAPVSEHAVPRAAGERAPFQSPSLSKFVDMQDIILLDPVHEVDSRGWPHASADV